MSPEFIRFKVSDFILYSEVPCPCGCVSVDHPLYVVDPGIVSIFDRWRMFVGHPLSITSFVRCPAHNVKVGGAVDSLHLCASAIDFYDPKSEITLSYLKRLEQVVGPGGLGLYDKEGHFHIDCGHLRGLTPYRRWRGVLK